MIKKTVITVTALAAAIFVFAVTVCAQEESLYEEQYRISGADSLYEALPDKAQRVLEDFDISTPDGEWTKEYTPVNIFKLILDFLKTGIKRPLTALCGCMGIILLCTVVDGIGEQKLSDGGAVDYIAVLATVTAVLAPLYSTLQSCISAVTAGGNFMLTFVPIYAGIVAAGGYISTAAGAGAVLLFAAEFTSGVISFLIMPLVSCYLAVGMCAGISPMFSHTQIAGTIQKAAYWILGILLTVFVGVLGIQTHLGTAADTVGSKAVKFALGTAIPVIGPSISEALGTVKGCMSALKTTVGIYGAAGVAAITAPVAIELLLWRAATMLALTAAELFDRKNIAGLLKTADGVIGVILGIILFCGMLFIISLTVVVKAGGI